VLKRLISDLLDYSRLENGTLRMEMEPLDLSALVSRVLLSAHARMSEDELKLTHEVPGNLSVLGDSVRLQQVFDNLIDNAAKFTDPGGEIAVGCRVEGGNIVISVKDNGCGIPASQVESIFLRFFQADNHSKRRKRGQGLGLAICKSIIESHGGRIWAESTLGVGTTMSVELPVLVPEQVEMLQHELEGAAAH
jgi:signal transduction histidine kinase